MALEYKLDIIPEHSYTGFGRGERIVINNRGYIMLERIKGSNAEDRKWIESMRSQGIGAIASGLMKDYHFEFEAR